MLAHSKNYLFGDNLLNDLQNNLSKCIKMCGMQPNFQFILFQGMT